MKQIDEKIALKAFESLDLMLSVHKISPFKLIVGGGASIVLAHKYPEATADIDGVPTMDFVELDPFVVQVGKKLSIPADWLNPHYQSYMHRLPKDYGSRLINVFNGAVFKVECLGATDLLIMKLLAGRSKDERHIRFLLKSRTVELDVVEKHLEVLIREGEKEAQQALDKFDDLVDEMELK